LKNFVATMKGVSMDILQKSSNKILMKICSLHLCPLASPHQCDSRDHKSPSCIILEKDLQRWIWDVMLFHIGQVQLVDKFQLSNKLSSTWSKKRLWILYLAKTNKFLNPNNLIMLETKSSQIRPRLVQRTQPQLTKIFLMDYLSSNNG
jgi:hypothetical protein